MFSAHVEPNLQPVAGAPQDERGGRHFVVEGLGIPGGDQLIPQLMCGDSFWL